MNNNDENNNELDFSRKKILRQSSVRETWLSFSKLHNSWCIHESRLELDYFNFIMFDHGLLDIISQPKTFKFVYEGKKYRYTPDYYLLYFKCEKIVEIKYFAKTQQPDFIDKQKAFTAYFAELGYVFEVVTEKTIRASLQANNNKILRLGLNHPVPIAEFSRIKKAIPKCHMCISELSEQLIKFEFKACFIRRALAHRVISADLKPRWSEIIINW